MKLIGEMYKPDIAFLPIGDLYTMGPQQAAKACELLGVKQVVPMHYGTFPALTGTPAKLRALLPHGVQILELKPGETAEIELKTRPRRSRRTLDHDHEANQFFFFGLGLRVFVFFRGWICFSVFYRCVMTIASVSTIITTTVIQAMTLKLRVLT